MGYQLKNRILIDNQKLEMNKKSLRWYTLPHSIWPGTI